MSGVPAGERIHRIEATPEAEQQWHEHVGEPVAPTLFPQAKPWYMGANIPGKKTEAQLYPGGLKRYIAMLNQVHANGYKGAFELS